MEEFPTFAAEWNVLAMHQMNGLVKAFPYKCTGPIC